MFHRVLGGGNGSGGLGIVVHALCRQMEMWDVCGDGVIEERKGFGGKMYGAGPEKWHIQFARLAHYPAATGISESILVRYHVSVCGILARLVHEHMKGMVNSRVYFLSVATMLRVVPFFVCCV